MGDMMRMVIAHEVGHALGFHIIWEPAALMKPKARDGCVYTKKRNCSQYNGLCSFNYITQPGDKTFVLYVKWELMIIMLVGVPIIPNSISTDRHVRQMDFGKKRKSTYKYGKQSSSFDPTSQTEDIGNSMKASSYGMKNLQSLQLIVRVDQ
jgi:hypothetical protein